MPCPASWIHQNRKLPTDEMQWFTLRCKIRERACPGWVKSPPADDVVYTAEDPQKADRIAAAPRTGGQGCAPARRDHPVRADRRAATAAPGTRRSPARRRDVRPPRPPHAGRRARRTASRSSRDSRSARAAARRHRSGRARRARPAARHPGRRRRARGGRTARRAGTTRRATARSGGRRARADGADDREVAVRRRPGQRQTTLARRVVDQTDAPRPGARRASTIVGSAGQPRPVWRADVAQRRGAAGSSARARPARCRRLATWPGPPPTRSARGAPPDRHAGPARRRAPPGTRRARPAPSRSTARPGHAAREPDGGVVADDVAGVGDVVQAQGEAQVRVGPDVVADDAGRPLRRQDEVHAEAAAALGDADQRRHEVGQLGRERRELVDDHDEARQRRRAPGAARQAVRSTAPTDRSTCSRRRSSASRLVSARAARCSSRSVTTPTVCGQVGAGVERRAALVVDEHERQVVRAAACREPTTNVRSSSLLPAPVVPAISACGPSRTRSIATTPSAATPSDGDGRRVGAAGAPRRGDGDGVVDRSGTVVGVQRAEADVDGQRAGTGGEVLRVAEPGERCGRRRSPRRA